MIKNENWEELVPKATVNLINEINGVERIQNLSLKEISEYNNSYKQWKYNNKL